MKYEGEIKLTTQPRKKLLSKSPSLLGVRQNFHCAKKGTFPLRISVVNVTKSSPKPSAYTFILCDLTVNMWDSVANYQMNHCVKSVRIQSQCRKMRTRKTPNTDTFYTLNDEQLTLFWMGLFGAAHGFRGQKGPPP